MRSVSVVLILVVAVLAIGNANPSNGRSHYDPNDAPALFQKFIKDYNRHYIDQDDANKHYDAFVQALIEINRLNDESPPGYATFGINQFTDYTKEEQESMFGLLTTVKPQ